MAQREARQGCFQIAHVEQCASRRVLESGEWLAFVRPQQTEMLRSRAGALAELRPGRDPDTAKLA
jgi:hypothetical protein